MANEKLIEALEPGAKRLEPGMIPDSACALLGHYVIAAVASSQAVKMASAVAMPFGMTVSTSIWPSTIITSTFWAILEEEWKVEAAQGFPGIAGYAWDQHIADTAYLDIWKQLKGKSMQQRIHWGWDMRQHFGDMAKASGLIHESTVYWFFYRALVNALYAVMKALKSSGLPASQAYSMIQFERFGVGESRLFNEAVVQLAAKAWKEMGWEELFSPDQEQIIAQTDQQFEAKMAMDWSEFQAQQAVLAAKIASLEDFKKLVMAAQTPFEALKKTLGALGDILLFLGKIPGFVWVLGGAAAGYFLVLKPALLPAKATA
jgi:hypothetical protein